MKSSRLEEISFVLQILLVLGAGYLLWKFRELREEDVDGLIRSIRKLNAWADRLP